MVCVLQTGVVLGAGREEGKLRQSYLESVIMIERLHRQFLDVLKAEIDRLRIEDVNNVQALILFNIGEDDLTIGELTARGYYLGSNVSYNVKKMFEKEYLLQERSPHDRRLVRVRLSDKGRNLRSKISEMIDRHVESLTQEGFSDADFLAMNEVLRRLERFLTDSVDQKGRHQLTSAA